MGFGEMADRPAHVQIVTGEIANSPATETDDLWVTVPGFHATERWGPCPFAPRVNAAGAQALPSRGDPCLVALDADGNAHVVLWWT